MKEIFSNESILNNVQVINQILRYIAILTINVISFTGNTVIDLYVILISMIYYFMIVFVVYLILVSDILLRMCNFVIKLHFFHEVLLLNTYSSEMLSI